MKTTFKSILNVTWKVALAIIGLVILINVIGRVANGIDRRYGRAPWGDKELSEAVTARHFKNGSSKVYDKASGKYLTGKLSWVSQRPRRDSITVYCDREGHRGYINCNTGKITIPADKAQYKRAWHFSDGYAFVVLKDEDSLSVIDHSGTVIARNVAPRRSGYDYVFEDGVCQLYEDYPYRTGFLKTDGTWAIEMKYFNIDYPNTEGYRIARNEEGYWLFDKYFNLVFPEPYEMIDFTIGREDTGLYLTKNHVKVMTTYEGKIVEPFVIDGTYDLKYKTKYNDEEADEYALDPDVVVYCVNGWEGLMDKHSCKILTPANYTNFTMISKDLIMAKLDKGYDDNAVVMDRRGNIIRQKKTKEEQL